MSIPTNLLAAWFFVLWMLCGAVCYGQQAHAQFSNQGSSNNLDSLINGFNQKYQSQLKAKGVPVLQKESDLKKYTTLSPAQMAPSMMNKKDRASYSRYLAQYQAAQRTASQLRQLVPIQNLSGLHLDSGTVYNNKYMKKYYDSLHKVMPTIPTSPMQTMTKQQMVKEVNKQFLDAGKKEKDSVDKVRSQAALEKKKVDQQKSKLEQLEKQDINKVDLAKTKIHDADAQELAPMAGTVVKSKYLNKLDSIRKADLKVKGLKLKEEATAAQTKLASIQQKEKLWNKSYFEGVIGIPQGSITLLQLSPALAYHISSHISLGAGPNLSIKRDLQKTTTTGGLRAFAKASFFQRHLYFQTEDQMNPHTISTEGSFFTQHNLYGGGGYVLPFLSPLTFNLSLMYKYYSNGNAQTSSSPWVFRIGISTNQKKNNK